MGRKIEKSLRSELERNFFGKTFTEIQNHFSLVKLNLTEEEIVDNRHEIKEVIQSQIKCGESKKFCGSLDKHYTLKRNEDGQFILVTEECKKIKSYRDISAESIESRINKVFQKTPYVFTFKEVLNIIEFMSQSPNQQLQEFISQIGDSDYVLNNRYICVEEYKRELCILYSFHAILVGIDVKVIEFSEVKNICIGKNFARYNLDDESSNNTWDLYQSLIDVDLLIILNLGIEIKNGRSNYYLDEIPELFKLRNTPGKSTYILTSVPWDLVIRNIEEKNAKLANSELERLKIKALNETMGMFSLRNN